MMRAFQSSGTILQMLTVFFLLYAFIPESKATPASVTNNYTSLARCLKVSNPSTATAKKVLDYVTLNQYLIVPPSGPLASNSGNTRQSTTSASRRVCPFTWVTDIDSNRRPSIMLKAVCSSSKAICAKCRAITYGHQVLKLKCNALWDWATVNLPVAFVRV